MTDQPNTPHSLSKAEQAIEEHNRSCLSSCEAHRKAGACEGWTSRGRDCTHCPKDWLIEYTVEAQDGVSERGATLEEFEKHLRGEPSQLDKKESALRLAQALNGSMEPSLSQDDVELITEALRAYALPSAKAPRISAIPLIKRLREQRDECADALRDLEHAASTVYINDTPTEEDWDALAKAGHNARAVLESVPTREQQLRNIADGVGMPYEELIAAVSARSSDSGRDRG